jgi:inner membrane protein
LLIAHLPFGYLLGAVSQSLAKARTRAIMAAALFGSVAPDLDMLYFHLIDERRTNHHDYFTHWPFFWLAVGAVLLMIAYLFNRPRISTALAFSLGTMLHMVMDSIAAPIHWLMPFDARAVELVTVPAAYSNWIWSFVLHWTFALEIAICVTALVLFAYRRRATARKNA